ncbi:MAG: ABC transporter permease [Lachnospiraceae bacterium]|nr:ABC transporter permease [Lachnospiraceae bacterium]
MENEYENIPQELFEFAQLDAELHDKKIETKARGYFADALIRFKKNKSSVVAAWIILLLVLFAIFSPIFSPYEMKDKDTVYQNFPPFVPSVADKKLGYLDGAKTLASQNELMYDKWQAIAAETGMDPVIRVLGTEEVSSVYRGKERLTTYYKLEMNSYYAVGIRTQTFSYEEFEAIQNFQNETGIQVIYPWVESKDIKDIADDPAIWYQVKDNKGTPKKDSDGNWIPAYSSNSAIEGAPYHSQRIEGDPGTWIYSVQKSGSVRCRFNYYNYYIFKNGHEPSYLFGTNNMGQDLFMAIGTGARFSLIFAILVSAVNLTIGMIYGSIQGYYGGMTDMVMDRIADIVGGIPFIVAVTLFQYHLASKVGPIVTFAFAFFLTGWIGMAALTRKQFYRFKGQEYVLAARTLGASDKRLMFKHIFPNSLGTIITSCALVIPGVISSETTLTYLGIVNLSDLAGTSIGTLMSQGQAVATTAPHAMVFPSIFISLLLISFNLFGNGLRDAFNPSMRGLED